MKIACALFAATWVGCSHDHPPSSIGRAERADASAPSPVGASAANASVTADASASGEPRSTPLRCDSRSFEVGLEWTEVVETSFVPKGKPGCYLFPVTDTSTRSSWRVKKKILAIEAGRVTLLRLTYLSDPGTKDKALEGATLTVDFTKEPPHVEGTKVHTEQALGDARASFVDWPKTDDPTALSKAYLAWRKLEPGEMRKAKATVKPAAPAVGGAQGSSGLPAARIFSFASDTSEESGGMCHSGSIAEHSTGTLAVLDGAFVVAASRTTTTKAVEGTCQGCGRKGDEPCPHVTCLDARETYSLRVACEP